MRKHNLITKPVSKASILPRIRRWDTPAYPVVMRGIREDSVTRYSCRLKSDTILHDDVEYFMTHNQQSVSALVDKLLSNDFSSFRMSDPSYLA